MRAIFPISSTDSLIYMSNSRVRSTLHKRGCMRGSGTVQRAVSWSDSVPNLPTCTAREDLPYMEGRAGQVEKNGGKAYGYDVTRAGAENRSCVVAGVVVGCRITKIRSS